MAHVLLIEGAPLMVHAVQMAHELASECASALRVVDNFPQEGAC
jgi:hypothetical protein